MNEYTPVQRVLRQARVVDQEKIEGATIGVRGSGTLADFIVLMLRGLGVGSVEHAQVHNGGFLELLANGEPAEDFALRMNPSQTYAQEITNSSYVIDTTKLRINSPLEACVIAGLIGQQVIDHCTNEEPRPYVYTPLRSTQGSPRALIVGAGATGTYVGLHAALQGFAEVDVLDGDKVDITNLNRQVLYYDDVGHSKAFALRKQMLKFGVAGEAFHEWLEDDQRVSGYDVVFSCVDRLEPRRVLDRSAQRNKFLLVDGGTSVHSGRVMSYLPETSEPLRAQVDLSGIDDEVVGCSRKTNPSIIMPNMIIGSYMVDEALSVLAGNEPRTIRYDSFANKVYENG